MPAPPDTPPSIPAWRMLGTVSIGVLAGEAPHAEHEGQLDAVRAQFLTELTQPSPFATVVANAALDSAAAMLLAIAVSCELDIALARAVSRVNDDLARPRLTLQIADRLMRDVGSSVADV
ncbi:MAG TPA: hypothetical protein PLV68_20660, partial [Ilumatobacteraceae bacterium]|nr:hypothetical protein [Ilumatobacteraceae bacterium]